MATGVSVDDRVVATYNEMRIGGSTKEKRKKAIMLRISVDLKTVILEEGKEILMSDCEKFDDVYKHFLDGLPKDDCRYAIYIVSLETKERKVETPVFIYWTPDSAPLKNKMAYVSTKDAVKRKFVGLRCEIDANKLEDLQDRRIIASKLRYSNIISFDGKPL